MQEGNIYGTITLLYENIGLWINQSNIQVLSEKIKKVTTVNKKQSFYQTLIN